jgi:ATP-dependent Clp protease, protease subunit
MTAKAFEDAPNKTAFATFAGLLDEPAVQRFFLRIGEATQKHIQHIHLLLQSEGGGVGQGVSLYNFFRNLPIELTIYNTGTIWSAAVPAFLGARHRKTSAHATFLLHRTTTTLQYGREPQFRATAENLALDDRRIDAILRSHITLSADKWASLDAVGSLLLTAEDSVACGIAEELGDFRPPAGSQVFAI